LFIDILPHIISANSLAPETLPQALTALAGFLEADGADSEPLVVIPQIVPDALLRTQPAAFDQKKRGLMQRLVCGKIRVKL
jgi:hypothetical protein